MTVELWAVSRDGEHWGEWTYPTMPAAVEAAPFILGLERAELFHVGRRVRYLPTVDAAAVVDQVATAAYDAVGDAAEYYLTSVPEEYIDVLQLGLQKVFEAWAVGLKVDRELWQVTDVFQCRAPAAPGMPPQIVGA